MVVRAVSHGVEAESAMGLKGQKLTIAGLPEIAIGISRRFMRGIQHVPNNVQEAERQEPKRAMTRRRSREWLGTVAITGGT